MVETEVQNEIILNVPLRKAKLSSRSRRADSAVNVLKTFVSKNTKTEVSKIWIDTTVNNRIWEKGKTKIPSKLTVKVVKLQDGTAEVLLP